MRFEWDAAKDRANYAKHGVNFETAARVFNDPNYLLIEDRTGEDRETRWHAIGMVGTTVLLVVHVYRSETDEEEVIRIISARKAREYESRGYFR